MKHFRVWAEHARSRHIALAVSGMITGTCLCFPVLGGLEWLSLVPALFVWFSRVGDERISLRDLYVDGLWFYGGFSLVIFHFFFYMYPLEFTGLYPAAALTVVLAAWLGLSLLQSLFGALLPLVLGVIARGRAVRRCEILLIPVTSVLWCVAEWCQTLNWTGVPWGRLALGQTEMPLMLGSARWFGSYAITFVLVAFNACIAYALQHTERRRLCALGAAGVFVFQLLSGVIVSVSDDALATGDTLTVAAIQGNIGSLDKWRMSADDSFYHYCELSIEAAAQAADIIVWPETAVPKNAEAQESLMPQTISQLITEHGGPVLLAGYYIKDADENTYNAIRAYDTDGSMVDPYYAKRHPVPFGEYVPMRELVEVFIPSLTQISQLSGDIAAGRQSVVFDTACGSVGALICFDSIYESAALDSVRNGAQLLIVSTNDSWFFDSAAVHMHHAQAKLRAVETGRYVVRAANTGISSVITPTGYVIAELGALEEGVLTGEVELRSNATLYVRIGNWPVILCLLGCTILFADCIFERYRMRKKLKTEENKKI